MQRGFTLVELSIVLVIVGLLMGGVLVGRDLVRKAQLRTVLTDLEEVQSATRLFSEQYNALPGDIPNATDYWPSAGGDGMVSGTCASAASNDTATCNGNGDRRIAYRPGASNFTEEHMFWQHLTNAGLMEGYYTGKAGPGSIWDSIPGKNVPEGALRDSGMGMTNRPAGSVHANWYMTTHGNFLEYGGKVADSISRNILFTPREQLSFEEKVDDGYPGLGKMHSFTSNFRPNCVTAGNEHVAEYRKDVSDVACSIMWIME